MSELKRKGARYAQLDEKLAAIGIGQKKVSIANRLSCEEFSAAFMLVCRMAIKTEHLHLA